MWLCTILYIDFCHGFLLLFVMTYLAAQEIDLTIKPTISVFIFILVFKNLPVSGLNLTLIFFRNLRGFFICIEWHETEIHIFLRVKEIPTTFNYNEDRNFQRFRYLSRDMCQLMLKATMKNQL